MAYSREAMGAIWGASLLFLLCAECDVRDAAAIPRREKDAAVAEASQDSLSPYGVGIALTIDRGSGNQDDIESKMARYRQDAELPGCLYMSLSLLFYWERALFEFEFLECDPDVQETPFTDPNHFIRVGESSLNLWMRHEIPVPFTWNRLSLLPGASIGYSWAGVSVEQLDDEESRTDTQVLSASGRVYAFGIVAEVLMVEHFYIGIDYRHRYWKGGPARTENRGLIYFPGQTELDFSGNYVGITLRLRRSW